MSIFEYMPTQTLNAIRRGNIYLWYGWQKAFCLFAPQVKQISTHGFVTAGCLDAVPPASPVTPQIRGPQLRENGSTGTDRQGFRGGAQDVVQCRAEVPSALD